MRLPAIAATCLTSLVLAQTASGANRCKPSDASLAGIYQLRGVMETGSTILLAPDGRFRYKLTYGAYDEIAEGCWQKLSREVILTASSIKKNASMGPSFKNRLRLSVNDRGELVRRMGPRQTGRYVRVRRWR